MLKAVRRPPVDKVMYLTIAAGELELAVRQIESRLRYIKMLIREIENGNDTGKLGRTRKAARVHAVRIG